MQNLLIIGIGGFIGANVRYLMSLWAAERFGVNFPWGTIIINFSGSCLLAVFVAWAGSHTALDPRIRLLVAVGFFGAYTTFSTYALESVTLFQAGNWTGALANVMGTNLVCILGVILGLAVGNLLTR